MKNQFTPRAEEALRRAKKAAEELRSTYIGSEHLLYGLVATEGCVAAKLLDGRGVRAADVLRHLDRFEKETETALSADDMTPKLRRILTRASKQTERMHEPLVGTEHLLQAILDEEENAATRMISTFSVTVGEIRSDLAVFFGAVSELRGERECKRAHRVHTALLAYGKDLTAVDNPDPVLGRETEIKRLIRILSRRQKNNPLLIGPPGVGKTAIVEGLAARIAANEVPEPLADKQIFAVDLSSMIAGAKYRGEFEERMKAVLEEAKKDRDVILFIDEIHTVIGAGSAEGAMDAANILKPVLARGEIRLIGATTEDEYTLRFEQDGALARRFQPLAVREPSEQACFSILAGVRERYESFHRVTIPDSVLREAIHLTKRYLPERFLPDKAIDLIDEAAASRRLAAEDCEAAKSARALMEDAKREKEAALESGAIAEAEAARGKEIIYGFAYFDARHGEGEARAVLSTDDLRAALADQIGVRASDLTGSEDETLVGLYAALCSEVFGQETACRALAAAAIRARVGIAKANKPLGSFLFAGPTGVGKTHLATTLARRLYGEGALIRLDMSEFTTAESISKLIGAPPGYVGYRECVTLCDRIRRRPCAVLLFDEIEKAHPQVFGLLLQLLDEGKLTDSRGRTADATQAIVILTSNLLTKSTAVGFLEANEKDSRRALETTFRPELVNRIDEVIRFKPLDKNALMAIARRACEGFTMRAEELGIRLAVDKSVISHLASAPDADHYGARVIQREIRRYLEEPFGAAVVDGTLKSGDRVLLLAGDDTVKMEKEIPALIDGAETSV